MPNPRVHTGTVKFRAHYGISFRSAHELLGGGEGGCASISFTHSFRTRPCSHPRRLGHQMLESANNEAPSSAARCSFHVGLNGRLQYMQQEKEGKTHGSEPARGFRQKGALGLIRGLRSRKNTSAPWFSKRGTGTHSISLTGNRSEMQTVSLKPKSPRRLCCTLRLQNLCSRKIKVWEEHNIWQVWNMEEEVIGAEAAARLLAFGTLGCVSTGCGGSLGGSTCAQPASPING